MILAALEVMEFCGYSFGFLLAVFYLLSSLSVWIVEA